MANLVGAAMELSADNEQFGFALSLFHDANGEQDPVYRIARYYAALESLASHLKGKAGNPALPNPEAGKRGSRQAISLMLGLGTIHRSTIHAGGATVQFDEIELARRVRDHLFHGLRLPDTALAGIPAEAWTLLKAVPGEIARMLRSHCELEVRKWLSDFSLARAVAEGRAIALAPDDPALTTVPAIGGAQVQTGT